MIKFIPFFLLIFFYLKVPVQQYEPLTAYSPSSDVIFHMIVCSDPQYPYTRPANRHLSKEKKIKLSKSNMDNSVKSFNKVYDYLGQSVRGTIINGDLVFKGKDENIKEFIDSYRKLKMTLYPGLGNHDFDKKYGINSIFYLSSYVLSVLRIPEVYGSDVNYAFRDMLNPSSLFDLSSQPSIPSSSFHMKYEGDFPSLGNGFTSQIKGSLAYSWDIGNFHFIQLNNHPLYGYTSSNVMLDYSTSPSIKWFISDVNKATKANKHIIVNFHQYGDDFPPKEESDVAALGLRNVSSTQLKTMNKLMARYINSSNVRAIFVGHTHNQSIRTDNEYIPDLRIFDSGAVMENNFYLVEFHAKKMVVYTMTSKDGNPKGLWDTPATIDF